MDTATAPDAARQTEVPEPLEAPPPSSGRRWRRVSALAAVLLAAAVAAFAISRGGGGPVSPARTALPSGETTALVVRRTLSESTTVDGTLGYGSAQNVYDRLAGTYTWLPAVGTVISRGGTLFRLDEMPVVLMYGSVPAYRALERGASEGDDVAELNRNLVSLGYDLYGSIAGSRSFGAATESAVRRWQKAEGLPVTGEVPLGRIVFATGARRVTALDVSLGQDPPAAETSAAETPSAETPAAETPATETPAAKSATAERPTVGTPMKKPSKKHLARKPGRKHPARKHPAPKSPAAKSSPTKSTPAAKSSEEEAASKSPTGKGNEAAAGGGELVMSMTPTGQVVTVALKAEQQTLARVGERAPVTLPNGRGVTGRIVSVGTVASEAKEEKSPSSEKGSEGEGATIPVTLALDRHVAHLDKAPVSVELVKSVRHDVLCVPATALTATAGGGYALQTLSGGRVSALLVTPGMFAGGYVEVEGRGVHAGLTVLEPR